MTDEVHHTSITQRVTRPGARPQRYDRSHYTPKCSCGWIGKTTTSRQDAVDDADEHVLAMARVE